MVRLDDKPEVCDSPGCVRVSIVVWIRFFQRLRRDCALNCRVICSFIPPSFMTSPVTIAHLSDVHLSPLRGFWPPHWNIKRALGFANWVLTPRRVHLRSVVDRLVADLRLQNVDHVAVTGDLVNIGLPHELENALRWLESIGPPSSVSVIPGNHDIYTRRWRDAGVAR